MDKIIMKIPKEIGEKGNKKANIKKTENKFFVHNKCCDSHWKLMANIASDKEKPNKKYEYILICDCGAMTFKIEGTVNESNLLIEPCFCGCGNYALYPRCCCKDLTQLLYNRVHWELVYYKDTNSTFIECEGCGKSFEISCDHNFKNLQCNGSKKNSKSSQSIKPNKFYSETVVYKIDESGPDTAENYCLLTKSTYMELTFIKKNDIQKFREIIERIKVRRGIVYRGLK